MPVYGVVPPVADTVTDAVPPLHAIVPADELADKADGCVMVTDALAEHPSAVETVTVYEPADKPEAVAVVAPFDQE